MFDARSIEVVMKSFFFHLKGRTLIEEFLDPRER
jgi:hypothetical protein